MAGLLDSVLNVINNLGQKSTNPLLEKVEQNCDNVKKNCDNNVKKNCDNVKKNCDNVKKN